jgi:hypothetical protein
LPRAACRPSEVRTGGCLQDEQKLNAAMQHLHYCYAKSAIQVLIDDAYLSTIETNIILEDCHEPDPRLP